VAILTKHTLLLTVSNCQTLAELPNLDVSYCQTEFGWLLFVIHPL